MNDCVCVHVFVRDSTAQRGVWVYIAVAGLLLALVYAGIFFCFILIFSFLKTLIYLFLAVLGLSCSAWASL